MRIHLSVSRLVAKCGVLSLLALSGIGGVAGFGSAAVPAYAAGPVNNYLVVFKSSTIPPGQKAKFQAAGGQLLASYDQIGVALVRSDNANFRGAMLADVNVDDAGSTTGLGYKLPNVQASDTAQGPPPGGLPNSSATDADSLSPLQWDMPQIKTPQAHAITGGSPAVLVGDIDTGVDFNHPDLKQNLDVANSANCLTGSSVPGLAAQDDNGHGTHTAGTIAAAAHGFGVVPECSLGRHQGGRRGRILLPAGGRVCLRLGGHAPHGRDQQQLLRRPLPLQLPQRRDAAGDLEGRRPRHPLCHAAGCHRRRGRGQRE